MYTVWAGKWFRCIHVAGVQSCSSMRSKPHKLSQLLDCGLIRDLSSQPGIAQHRNWVLQSKLPGTPNMKLQEDSCPIIGICIFVLIVSLQNTSVKLQRVYLTSIADRFFYTIHESNVLCAFSSVLFTTWISHALTQFTTAFIFVTVALSLSG